MIKENLEKVIAGKNLSSYESSAFLEDFIAGNISEIQAGAFLTALRIKGESVEEIVGFVDTMEKHMIKIELDNSDSIDMCGTGGDGSHSFNVSTTAALIVAAGNVTVAKHGNRSISSKCGSADLLEKLGVNINLSPEATKQCINEIGIGFLFAPLYHPAMKKVAPVRKNLQIRTVFNILGPLLNPAKVRRQLIGTYNLETAQKLAKVLATKKYKKACTVHSCDGYDEVSPFSESQIFEVTQNNEQLNEFRYSPKIKNKKYQKEEIQGNSIEENVQITLNILNGKKGIARDMAIINAAFGFHVADKVKSIDEGIEYAETLVDNGDVLSKLSEFKEMSNSFNN
jgi:anthranilate phosphoribosyltransferase